VDGELMATRRKRLKAALDLVTHVIAPSEFMYSQFEQIIEPGRLTFSRIGTDIDRLQTGLERGVGKTLRFGYVGQVAHHKGVHFLVRAFKALEPGAKAIELHIWGGVEANPEYAQTLRQVANGDRRIVFHGRFDHPDLLDVLNDLDYLVVPSIWYENCPLTILESYAADLPVICSDHGGMAELVNHGQDGLVFRPGDTVDLAKAMQSVVNDTQLNLQLQHGARRRLVRDTSDEMHQLTAIYELVNARTHSAVRHV
jgi:glycosyltransferase involved in cell wall biosynthesis